MFASPWHTTRVPKIESLKFKEASQRNPHSIIKIDRPRTLYWLINCDTFFILSGKSTCPWHSRTTYRVSDHVFHDAWAFHVRMLQSFFFNKSAYMNLPQTLIPKGFSENNSSNERDLVTFRLFTRQCMLWFSQILMAPLLTFMSPLSLWNTCATLLSNIKWRRILLTKQRSLLP